MADNLCLKLGACSCYDKLVSTSLSVRNEAIGSIVFPIPAAPCDHSSVGKAGFRRPVGFRQVVRRDILDTLPFHLSKGFNKFLGWVSPTKYHPLSRVFVSIPRRGEALMLAGQRLARSSKLGEAADMMCLGGSQPSGSFAFWPFGV